MERKNINPTFCFCFKFQICGLEMLITREVNIGIQVATNKLQVRMVGGSLKVHSHLVKVESPNTMLAI